MNDVYSNSAEQKRPDKLLQDLAINFHTDLVSFANRILRDPQQSEDVTQEAYIRFQAKINSGYNSELSAKGYLYRIVRNLSIDYHRRKKYEGQLFCGDAASIETVADNQNTLEDVFITNEELTRIQAGLDTLPERTRMAFEMHRFGGYTMQKIAEHFGISKSMATRLVAEGLVMCRRSRARSE